MNDLAPMWMDGALRRRDLAWANANSCAASGLAELVPPTRESKHNGHFWRAERCDAAMGMENGSVPFRSAHWMR